MPGATSPRPPRPAATGFSLGSCFKMLASVQGTSCLVWGAETRMLSLPTAGHGHRAVPNPWAQGEDGQWLLVPISEHPASFAGGRHAHPCCHTATLGLEDVSLKED